MVKMKKYILLDFDGVMIPSKPWKPVTLLSDDFYEFSDSAIYNLNRIVNEIKGIGVFFPKLQEGICTYEDYWLVFIENSLVPEKIHKTEVFEDLSKNFRKKEEGEIFNHYICKKIKIYGYRIYYTS